jgi:hypothetical protein
LLFYRNSNLVDIGKRTVINAIDVSIIVGETIATDSVSIHFSVDFNIFNLVFSPPLSGIRILGFVLAITGSPHDPGQSGQIFPAAYLCLLGKHVQLQK